MFTTWALILPAHDVDSDPHPCLRNVSAVPNIQLEVTCNKKKKIGKCESHMRILMIVGFAWQASDSIHALAMKQKLQMDSTHVV